MSVESGELQWRQDQINRVLYSHQALWISRHAPKQMIPPPDIHGLWLSRRHFSIAVAAWWDALSRIVSIEKKNFRRLGMTAF
jgi:hypothetical protein